MQPNGKKGITGKPEVAGAKKWWQIAKRNECARASAQTRRSISTIDVGDTFTIMQIIVDLSWWMMRGCWWKMIGSLSKFWEAREMGTSAKDGISRIHFSAGRGRSFVRLSHETWIGGSWLVACVGPCSIRNKYCCFKLLSHFAAQLLVAAIENRVPSLLLGKQNLRWYSRVFHQRQAKKNKWTNPPIFPIFNRNRLLPWITTFAFYLYNKFWALQSNCKCCLPMIPWKGIVYSCNDPGVLSSIRT